MIFKTNDSEDELKHSPQKLQEVAALFDQLSTALGIQAVVSRVWDGVCGDSGVHEAHRGTDFRDETFSTPTQSEYLYTAAQANSIVSQINAQYPRTDGKKT